MVVTNKLSCTNSIKAKIQWLSERFSNHNCLRYSLNGISIIFLMYMYNIKLNVHKVFIGLRRRIFEIIGTVRSMYIFKLILIQSTWWWYLKISRYLLLHFVLIQNSCHRNIFDVIDLNSKTRVSPEYIHNFCMMLTNMFLWSILFTK